MATFLIVVGVVLLVIAFLLARGVGQLLASTRALEAELLSYTKDDTGHEDNWCCHQCMDPDECEATKRRHKEGYPCDYCGERKLGPTFETCGKKECNDKHMAWIDMMLAEADHMPDPCTLHGPIAVAMEEYVNPDEPDDVYYECPKCRKERKETKSS